MENTQYWAMLNGIRRGPMSLHELSSLGISADTPVWRAGLPDWTSASCLPELAGIIVPGPPIPPLPLPQQLPVAAAPGPVYVQPNPPVQADPAKAMPPTYLAWSIVTMLLCCIVTGIIALIYSTKVSSRYTEGDYRGAKSASETALIWVIVTIVLGLIALPFQILLSML